VTMENQSRAATISPCTRDAAPLGDTQTKRLLSSNGCLQKIFVVIIIDSPIQTGSEIGDNRPDKLKFSSLAILLTRNRNLLFTKGGFMKVSILMILMIALVFSLAGHLLLDVANAAGPLAVLLTALTKHGAR
jgi:hypothetical protein